MYRWKSVRFIRKYPKELICFVVYTLFITFWIVVTLNIYKKHVAQMHQSLSEIGQITHDWKEWCYTNSCVHNSTCDTYVVSIQTHVAFNQKSIQSDILCSFLCKSIQCSTSVSCMKECVLTLNHSNDVIHQLFYNSIEFFLFMGVVFFIIWIIYTIGCIGEWVEFVNDSHQIEQQKKIEV